MSVFHFDLSSNNSLSCRLLRRKPPFDKAESFQARFYALLNFTHIEEACSDTRERLLDVSDL